jgi:hypothetical protein
MPEVGMSAVQRLMSTIVVGMATLTGSCSSAAPAPLPIARALPPIDAEPARIRSDVTGPSPVVLVTIDGARWQEIFEGVDPARVSPPRPARTARELMPVLHDLARDRGAMLGADAGAAIRASGPNYVSLPGYLEILTGRPPIACRDNDCPQTRTPTFLDDAASVGLRVAAFASWERLARAATARPGSFHVSAGREPGDATHPWPGSGEYRPDARTASLALDYLEREQPDVLFLALGDPDEHAHHGDYDGYLRALEQADGVLRRLFAVLDTMGDRGRATHVFVTADHGRARDFRNHGGFAPESSRVWLVAAGPRIKARGASRSPRERRLADVAPTIEAVLGLERPRGEDDGDVLGELLE